ncbi:MAG TPA: hypothetical protein VFY18_00890 [Candidatus Limnocylindrales bacterium]|nr:hypothetical protein [Candidatus Limnocylindrales bacterium]
MLAMLEELRLGPRGRFDLVRGAIDARLHAPTRLPAIAALLAGGLWTFAGAGVVAQPTPPDWPGYLLESLPLALVAVVSGGLAIVGCWATRSDDAGRPGTVAILLALAGHILWIVALVAALVGFGYGATTALAQDMAAVGSLLVGIGLLRAGDGWLGGLLALGAALMVFGWPIAWLGFGLAWTLVGALLLSRFDPNPSPPSRLA